MLLANVPPTSLPPHPTALFHTLEVRDLPLARHSGRVAVYAMAVASALGLGVVDRAWLYSAARMHDIGKLLLPEGVFNHPRPLSQAEWRQVKSHPGLGEWLLLRAGVEPEVCQAVRHHHERWDGAGYPDRLAGEQIPLLARIIAVCDTFDAMVEYRPYRLSLSLGDAFAELRRVRGKQLDPAVVDAFVSLGTRVIGTIAVYSAGYARTV